MVKNTLPNNYSDKSQKKQPRKLKKYDVVSCSGPAGSTMIFGVIREIEAEPDIVWTDIPNTGWQEGYTLVEEIDDILNDEARNETTDLLHSVLTEDD